jgi:CubicO group peptidase (beta-lactamase class C family)
VGQYVSGLHPDLASATIAQLLSHTAGICRDGMEAPYWVDRAPSPDESLVDRELVQSSRPAYVSSIRIRITLAGQEAEPANSEPLSPAGRIVAHATAPSDSSTGAAPTQAWH